MSVNPALEINETTYQRCVGAFSFVRERLGININVHDAEGKVDAGQIFLFNHFARFETIIPQYIIYQATGAFCRCIAAGELFDGNEAFARFLWGVGAVPTDHPDLLSFLAAETLRGRKVIFFPRGRHDQGSPGDGRSGPVQHLLADGPDPAQTPQRGGGDGIGARDFQAAGPLGRRGRGTSEG